jgi:hypothetical protein
VLGTGRLSARDTHPGRSVPAGVRHGEHAMGRPPGGQYSPEEIDRALLVYIRTGGNCTRTARILNEDPDHPLPIDFSTLTKWTRPDGPHHQRYRDLHEQHAPALEAEAVHNARELVSLIAEKERAVLERLDPAALDQRDLAGTLRNLSTSKSLQVDKAILPLTGRDLAGRTERGPDELIQSLKQAAPHLFATPVHADAQEIHEEPKANASRAIPSVTTEATRTS